MGNTWQYLKTTYNSDGSSYELSYILVEEDTTIGNLKYYKTTNFSELIRYSKEERKLYIRWNNSDYVNIDFNIPDGMPYQSFSGGQFRTVYAKAGEENIFNLDRAYGGYLYIPSNWGYEVLYTDSIGMSYDRSADSFLDVRRNIIEAIIYDSTGKKIYFTNHYQPNFEITPITLIDSAYFYLQFKVKHPYTKILNPNHPPFLQGLDFIDSVTMYSYYMNNDSMISNLPVTPIHSSDPVNDDYLISIQIDTVLMKNGFAFNYRFLAKDKGIIPEYSYSPDSGYYQCIWDETTGIENGNDLPAKFLLYQNYPNPFNPTTKIKYTIPNVGRSEASPNKVMLKVYDILGREVATLVNEEKPPGNYEVEFNGTNLPSGVYFYRIKAGSFIQTRKMVLLR